MLKDCLKTSQTKFERSALLAVVLSALFFTPFLGSMEPPRYQKGVSNKRKSPEESAQETSSDSESFNSVYEEEPDELLYYAAARGNVDDARRALVAGANVNSYNDTENLPPLYIAGRNGHAELVSFLLDNGADFTDGKEDYYTALYVAAVNAQSEVVKIFFDRGFFISMPPDATQADGRLINAVVRGDEQGVIAALADGADINVKDLSDHNPLRWAAVSGHSGLVSLLLEQGANYTNFGSNPYYCLPLQDAADSGHYDVVHLMLNFIPEECAKEALVVAIIKHDEAFVIYLLMHFVLLHGCNTPIDEALTHAQFLLRSPTTAAKERPDYERIQRILLAPLMLASSVPHEKFEAESRRDRATTFVTSILGRKYFYNLSDNSNEEPDAYGIIQSILKCPSIPVRYLLNGALRFMRERLGLQQGVTQEEKINYGALDLLMRPATERNGATVTLAMLNRLPKELLFVVLAHALQSIAKSL